MLLSESVPIAFMSIRRVTALRLQTWCSTAPAWNCCAGLASKTYLRPPSLSNASAFCICCGPWHRGDRWLHRGTKDALHREPSRLRTVAFRIVCRSVSELFVLSGKRLGRSFVNCYTQAQTSKL